LPFTHAMSGYYAHAVCASCGLMISFDDGPKKPTNLSLNSKVLDLAKELGMNVSQTVDELLAAEVRRVAFGRWLEENRDAIDAYNDRVRRKGMWNSGLRKRRGSI